MVHTSDKSLHLKEEGAKYIFLAGSMNTIGQDSWREAVVTRLGASYNYFDPTNTNHNILNDIEMRKHITWELDALKICDKIILNLLPKLNHQYH